MNNPADTLAALAPCPFCGGDARVIESRLAAWSTPTFAVGCEPCNMVFCENTQAESIAAWNRRASLKGEAVPSPCDGKEQEAFESWARGAGYDMAEHPLHWLFLNERTYAARQGWAAALEYANKIVTAPPAPQAEDSLPVELIGISEALDEGDGCWRPCTGCHEWNEGVPTGPTSKVFRCVLGVGCQECGGIGAIWDTTDYGKMADEMAVTNPTPSPAPQGGGEARSAERIVQAWPTVSAFYDRWALGSKLPPSCFCCGKFAVEIGVQHLELPDIIVCAECKERATPPAQQPGEVGEAKYVTPAMLSDAFGCFWNAAMNAAFDRQDSTATATVGAMVEGFAAVAARLKEHAALAPKEKGNG